MHDEIKSAGILAGFAGWMAEHWPWIAGVVTAMAWAARKAFGFFQGINRQADATQQLAKAFSALAEEQKAQREKLDKMVDGPGVDLRVAPVIETVSTMQAQITQIYNHLLNRDDKRERATDK